jgi:flagellar biosynthesis anti-sigma factor FlgM
VPIVQLQGDFGEEINMRINLNQGAQEIPESGRTKNSSLASADAQASASSAPGEDSTQLSGTHIQVQALVAQALQFPEVRQEKVNALRQLVESGSYQPSAQQVGDALFDHMLVSPAA